MVINNYDELIYYAGTFQSDLEKIKFLQTYFLENVQFYYLEEVSVAIINNDYGIENCSILNKKVFVSEEDKSESLKELEKFFGDKFEFSKEDRTKILNSLGIKTEEKVQKLGGKLNAILTIPSRDGSLRDTIPYVGGNPNEPLFINGLIKSGMCRDFSPFAKKYCNDLGIECHIVHVIGHQFNIVLIDGEYKIFDFTRMIGIRDDFHNDNNEKIDDWFNMTFEKMFELKPERQIIGFNDKAQSILKNPITKDNFKNFFISRENIDQWSI